MRTTPDLLRPGLDLVFVGFPETLQDSLREAALEQLASVNLVDTKDWWIPRIAKFGAEDDSDKARALRRQRRKR